MAAVPDLAVDTLKAPWQPRLQMLGMSARESTRPPILMVHGAYTHAASWMRTFMPWFAARGHDVHALSLRGHGGSDGRHLIDAWGLDDYRADVADFFAAHAFFEVETARRLHVFGNIAHAWSVYEARTAPDDETPERRGINSIQLYRGEDGRWRIISMIWDNERPGITVGDI